MARMPRETRTIRLICLALMGLGMTVCSGCQLGGTHFQYSSGSSPFFGIDLIPRKKESATTISHERKAKAPERRDARVDLVENEAPDVGAFEKKPLRLNLPASRDSLQPTELSNTPESNFAVSAFSETTF